MSFTTSVTSTTLSPATTPSLKSSKNASFMCAPQNCNETCSRYADNNFAKMRSRGHVPVGRLRLIEGEYLIDYRLNAAHRHRMTQRLKHLHRADGDALHVSATGKDYSRIEFGCRTPPIRVILPPTRIAPNERASVVAPPTSTTWSTPRPPVNPSAAFSQSGVVL